jgi:diguanylate cyclase (GGDEF)-like protein/PAS domain S-box-containing protein
MTSGNIRPKQPKVRHNDHDDFLNMFSKLDVDHYNWADSRPATNPIKSVALARMKGQDRLTSKVLSDALNTAVDHSAIVAVTDQKGRIIYANDRFCKISEYSRDELIGQNHRILNSGTHPLSFFTDLWQTIAAGGTWHGEICNVSKSGHHYWVDTIIMPFSLSGAGLNGYLSIRHDITATVLERQALEAERRARSEMEGLVKNLLSALPLGVAVYDSDDRLTYANDAFMASCHSVDPTICLGMAMDAVIERTTTGLIKAYDGDQQLEKAQFLSKALELHHRDNGEGTFQIKDGRWIRALYKRLESGHFLVAYSNITVMKKAEIRLRRQAERDELTGLANRSSIFKTVRTSLRTGGQTPSGVIAVLDLDFFKAVNDSLGHRGGDTLLARIGRRLTQTARNGEFVARMGGDEFAVFMPTIKTATGAMRRLNAFRRALQEPLRISDYEIKPQMSMGFAVVGKANRKVGELFRQADTALMHAKSAGRAVTVRFDADMHQKSQNNLTSIQAIREAVENKAFECFYQPQVDLETGAHVGFEALARWVHNGIYVPPSEFIPLAEHSGLIVPLGMRILELALAFQGSKKKSGLAPGTIAVNVAAAQMKLDNFVPYLASLIEKNGLIPADVEIEVTETVLLDRSAGRIVQTLNDLHTLGVKVALDDFGTGYASLAHLQRFKIDKLKIDRSFISEIGTAEGKGVIARTVISLANSLGIGVIAEGLENQTQVDFVLQHGCKYGQGYLFARPMAREEASKYLRSKIG